MRYITECRSQLNKEGKLLILMNNINEPTQYSKFLYVCYRESYKGFIKDGGIGDNALPKTELSKV